jgi:hypothetical protein
MISRVQLDESPDRAIIHIYMEMLQRNSLYSYLKQKCLFFFKNGEEMVKQVLSGEFVRVGGEGCKERCRRMNVVEIVCTHV